MNKDFELLLKLNIKMSIEESNLHIMMINNSIKFYQLLINNLHDSKPLFFQKKKLRDYNKQLDEYNLKINDLYIELEKEFEMINKLSSN